MTEKSKSTNIASSLLYIYIN